MYIIRLVVNSIMLIYIQQLIMKEYSSNFQYSSKFSHTRMVKHQLFASTSGKLIEQHCNGYASRWQSPMHLINNIIAFIKAKAYDF